MTDEMMSPQTGAEMPVETTASEPQVAETQDAAPGKPDTSGLSPEQSNAFGKKWNAERTKLEQSVREQMEGEYRQKLANLQPPPPPPPALEDDAAELAKINEDLLAQFYDNPIMAMKRAQEVLTERKTQREQAMQAQWDYQARVMASQHADWQEMVPKMQALLKDHPDLAERPEHLGRVYQLAKGYNGAPSPEASLQNPAVLEKAKTMLRDQIIQEYVTGKRDVQASAPLMGGTTGGQAPAMPPATPKTWADAKKAAMARLGQ